MFDISLILWLYWLLFLVQLWFKNILGKEQLLGKLLWWLWKWLLKLCLWNMKDVDLFLHPWDERFTKHFLLNTYAQEQVMLQLAWAWIKRLHSLSKVYPEFKPWISWFVLLKPEMLYQSMVSHSISGNLTLYSLRKISGFRFGIYYLLYSHVVSSNDTTRLSCHKTYTKTIK